MTINFDAYRPVVAGTRHAVASGHYLAAEADFEILNHGGNAIDAGVAAGIALGVVHSDIVGVAGVAPTIIWLADRQEMVCIDGLGTWPKAGGMLRRPARPSGDGADFVCAQVCFSSVGFVVSLDDPSCPLYTVAQTPGKSMPGRKGRTCESIALDSWH